MVKVDIGVIQKLRDATGAGVMSCKKAYAEAKGDFDKAVALIKEWGLVKVEQKSDRSTGAGLLETYIHNDRVGVMLELRCESDFVARSDVFKGLSHNLVMQIAAMEPADIENLLSQPFIKDESITIDSLVKDAIARLGENIQVKRFCRYEL
ncbi:MAG: translation elongation factor Ts [Candidatus Marinimicrobia bacterium]|nr:translation elongation factor Ts [Candidatus Neomarinimicrobiota bacterium]